MIDEQSLRRPAFVEGARIRLANGQDWSFPDHPPYKDDDDHIAMLRAIGEAEDEPERLRTELALTIFLLSRNYELTPAGYGEILGYATGDPALAEMQRAVHELATRQYKALRRLSDSNSRPPRFPTAHWSLACLLRRRNRVVSSRSHWLN